MRVRNMWMCTLSVALVISVAACGGSKKADDDDADSDGAPAAAATSSGGGQKVDPATAGNVTGMIALDGKAPTNDAIKMNADPVCAKANTTPQAQETFAVGADGKSLGNYSFDAPTTPVQLDQKSCRYHPHVFGARVNQPIEILNSDPTLHNIHAQPKDNQEFNNGQPIQGMKMTHAFTAKEVMVPFKCDVHGWMNAYVGIMDHPYFATTKEDGKFELAGLPPGTYTIEAWHEKLGAMTQSVTIGAKESKELNFTFKAPAAAN